VWTTLLLLVEVVVELTTEAVQGQGDIELALRSRLLEGKVIL
jgi:hypothetical protein